MKQFSSLMLSAALLFSYSAQAIQSTLADQTDVAITAYNGNIALVRDRRKITLPEGEHSLTFMDVAAQIKPETVSLKSVTAPRALHVLEQNYEYDLLSPQKILEKYIGKMIKLRNFAKDIAFEEVDAELLSLNGGPIYKVGNEIHLNHPGSVILPQIPDSLIAKPSLVWLLDNTSPLQHDIVVTYMTGGIQWNADYILTLDRSDEIMDVEGWVTLHNNAGTSFNNAQLKLVAGDVHRASHQGGNNNHIKAQAMMRSVDSMKQESFGDFHLYTLPRKTTIKDNQTKQVHLMGAQGVAVKKIYEYRGQSWYYNQPMQGLQKSKVGVFLKFKNSENNNMGMPLPAGVLRVYQEDSSGALQFAGEDRIDHTPKDENVTIKLGDAFDVIAERLQTEHSTRGHNVHNSSFKITLRNHKDKSVTVNVIEPLSGNWTVTKNSHSYKKLDAHTISFPIDIPQNGETTLTYSVTVSH